MLFYIYFIKLFLELFCLHESSMEENSIPMRLFQLCRVHLSSFHKNSFIFYFNKWQERWDLCISCHLYRQRFSIRCSSQVYARSCLGFGYSINLATFLISRSILPGFCLSRLTFLGFYYSVFYCFCNFEMCTAHLHFNRLILLMMLNPLF